MDILITIFSAFIFFPPLLFIILFLLFRIITSDTAKSMKRALDWTTPFLLLAVYFLFKNIFQLDILIYMLIAITILLLFLYIRRMLHKKREKTISNLYRGMWRLTFLFASILYVVCVLYGIILEIRLFL